MSSLSIQRRRELWHEYRKRLGEKAPAIARITGLTPATVRYYSSPASSAGHAPSQAVLMLMRSELARRSRRAVEDAREQLARAEIEREEVERECREHVAENPRMYAADEDEAA